MFLYGSTVKILFITLCWFRLVIALVADDALWYFTIAVVNERPKLSCSMRHFYSAPSVENNLYKSSFVKSGCRPITFNVRPFYCACSIATFGSFLWTWVSFFGAREILLRPTGCWGAPDLCISPPIALILSTLLTPPPLLSLSSRLKRGRLLSFLIACCLLAGLNFLVRLSLGRDDCDLKGAFLPERCDLCCCLSFWIY